MEQMSDFFVEYRYFNFQDEIQFFSNTTMEYRVLKHCDSESFCGCNRPI